MKRIYFLSGTLILFTTLLLLSQCSPIESSTDDPILAKVYNKYLYLSDLESMIPEGMSAEDSALIINAYTERWVREAVMMHEAERNIPQDLDIDELVQDYRASLILNNYEKKLVEQLLDSTILEKDLKAFYDKNKEQYKLKEPVLRCRLIKIDQNTPDLAQLDNWWNDNDTEDRATIIDYLDEYSELHLLNDSTWYKLSEIAPFWVGGNLRANQLPGNQPIVRSDGTFKYYLKVNELIPAEQQLPISYVKDQAKKVILHKRKMELLNITKEDMYEEALRKNAVQIFRD